MTSAPPREKLKPRRDHQGRSLEEEGMGACLTQNHCRETPPGPSKLCVCVCVGQATDAASLCAGARGSGHIPFPREAFQGAKLHHLPRRRSAAAALRSRPQRRNKSAAQSRGQRASSPLNPASVQPLLAPRSPPLSQLLAPSSKCCSYKQLTQILGLN